MKLNYWIFQATPDVFDLRGALKNAALQTFAVRAHKDKIKIGDKVILWLTGESTGCYALCEVISEITEMQVSEKEKQFFLKWNEKALQERVQLKVEYNLWNNPIYKEELSKTSTSKLKVNIPGTNFQATKSQYHQFIEHIEMRNQVQEPISKYIIPTKVFKHPINQILYGPPGTGKTYQSVNYALSIIEEKTLADLEKEDRIALQRRFQAYKAEGRIQMVTFHQSFTYEDFIEGIKPFKTEDKQVYYDIEDGVFKQIAEQAVKELRDEQGKLIAEHLATPNNYVLIIDEINRGNISAIFGELITLIEADKRMGKKEAISVQLPYSKQSFTVPDNLYLIGTMNTADRSAEALDNALRRRFNFVELSPKPALLHQIGKIDLVQILIAVNKRIEVLIDKEHQIGHAFFMNVHTISALKQLFQYKLIPQLQEYFYGDWGKIGLILGKAFIKMIFIEENAKQLFANFNYDARDEYEGHTLYEVTDSSNWDEAAFLAIYE